MALIDRLLRLQGLDQEWDEKLLLYQSARAKLADQSELKAQRETQRQRSQRLATQRALLRDAELELESLQRRGRQVEVDLYSGRITAPRELESLRQDGEYLKRRISEAEDQALALMTEVDELESAVSKAQEALDAFEARWASERQSLSNQFRELHARLQQLKVARQEMRGTLDRATLALYEELRRSKNGEVLSPAIDCVCQTCRVSLPSRKASLLQSGETVVTCEGCGRILYQP